MEDSLLKYFSSINSNIIDSVKTLNKKKYFFWKKKALHLAAHFLSDAGIPARCLLREGIINNVVEVYKFKRLEK